MDALSWLPPSVALIELVCFASGIVPLVADLRFLWKLRGIQLKLRADGVNGADNITIQTHIGLNWFVCFGHMVITAVGVYALFAEPCAPDIARTPNPPGVVVTMGLFGLSAILSGITFWNSRRWRMIGAYMQRRGIEIRAAHAT